MVFFSRRGRQSYRKILRCIRPTCEFITDPMLPNESPGAKGVSVRSFWLPPDGRKAIIRILPKGAFSSGTVIEGRFRDLLWLLWISHEDRRQPFLWSLNMLTMKALLSATTKHPDLTDPEKGRDIIVVKGESLGYPIYTIQAVEYPRPLNDWEREWIDVDLFETGGKRA